ncbi:hypothetical protein QAD02_006948 [Eretmocerus hayati]|uniref:Uncharacterized protein n=1 Tax=Eretmocerus hayati TaxID=131215 RepID=A0ACC2N2N2_9HYME|nr:hypothetical protein QAD02_006948 [Eretmocerus hayati]
MSSEDIQEPEKIASITSNAEGLGKSKSNSQVHRRQSLKGEIRSRHSVGEKLSSKMFSYARETICFFLAVAFTALAALHSSPPRVSKPPLAKPFFNESSLVLDFYKGHLSALVDRVTDSDFSFVMYYAPWDADSQDLKDEFEKVAQYYHSQIFFAAINCWHPGSECRIRYNKIQSYPVIMLYPSKESGIQYRGVLNAPYMIRFIKTFMNPVVRVDSDEQLMEVLTTYDAVMIGYFKFSGLSKSPGYKEFYKTALKSLEKDPNGETAFAVVTSPHLAKEHNVEHFPSASLLMWNETLFYPDNGEWTADGLFNWMNNAVHRVVTWLQPPGSKSSTLASYFWEGPVLFMFTPRNPLHLESDNYNLLREIGLSYFDCSENAQVEELIALLQKNRKEAPMKYFKKRDWCASIFQDETAQGILCTGTKRSRDNNKRHCKEQQNHWTNTTETGPCCSDTPTNKCVVCETKSRESASGSCTASGFFSSGADAQLSPMQEELRNAKTDNTCIASNSFKTSATKRGSNNEPMQATEDPYSAESLTREFYRSECKRFLAGYSYQRPLFSRKQMSEENSPDIELVDDVCRLNKSLALVAIDSLRFFHFAEGLGIDLRNQPDHTAVVIVDPADESQYVMQERLNRNTLVNFINNYTKGYLKRTMRSNTPRRFVRSFITKSECKESEGSRICVPELSSENFLDTVLNPDKDVVVMYHSPYCAFCSAVAYVFLTVAHYLSKMVHLEFVRIDGDNNDLPWEYTMNRYPSILFFPARRKEDSTLYPWTLPVSVGNLLSFVLANLDEESHLEALVELCALGVEPSSRDCLARTRKLCLDVTAEHLRNSARLLRLDPSEIHRARRLRRILLLKLELVRKLHLILGATDDLVTDKRVVKALRRAFKGFYTKLSKIRRDSDNNEMIPAESESLGGKNS